MRELRVKCPQCARWCGVDLECGDLAQGLTTEDFVVQCDGCGCRFCFDVYVDVLNKKPVTPKE